MGKIRLTADKARLAVEPLELGYSARDERWVLFHIATVGNIPMSKAPYLVATIAIPLLLAANSALAATYTVKLAGRPIWNGNLVDFSVQLVNDETKEIVPDVSSTSTASTWSQKASPVLHRAFQAIRSTQHYELPSSADHARPLAARIYCAGPARTGAAQRHLGHPPA